MPEDCGLDSDLELLVDNLEDYTLNVHNYQTLQYTLEAANHFHSTTAEKLLALCIRDGIEDLKYAAHALNIIGILLKKIKDGQCTTPPNLVPSALAVLNVLKASALYNKVESLKTLCFEIITSYPDETLVSVCSQHSKEIFEFINLYCNQSISAEIRVQPVNLLARLLKILPPDKKSAFVKDGIKVWFSRVIPVVATSCDTMPNMLEALVLLTEDLVQFDYFKNEDWYKVLENIHTPKRYPALMKNLLETGSPHWHQLWIIFIKLLKTQITKCTNTTASPINALLPCVEMAFKMDIKNRCRAFQCWNVLIDNFSKETNEAFLHKRLKLLIVPLTSNNAKVEETALAKFTVWWHLVSCFQYKLEKFLEMVIIPFLSFCFGKPTGNTLIPGKLSKKIKVQCVQAFINIVGHTQCDGCVELPKLNVKLLNTKLLVNNWKDWIHSLSCALKICVEQNGDFSEQQIKCVWKSVIMTIGELPENNIRRDLFSEFLIMLEGLTQDCENQLMKVIVNVLIPTLFDGEEKIQALLKSKDEKNAPFNKIVAVLNKLSLDSLDDRKAAIGNLKPLTDWLVDDAFKTSSNKIEWFLKTLSSNGLLLWTVLAESISFKVYTVCPRMLAKMFLWPFNFINNFAAKEESTSAWLNLYKTISPYLSMKPILKDILKALSTHKDNPASYVFTLSVAIAVLEQKLTNEDTDLDKDIELILHLTSKMSDSQLKVTLSSLADVIVHILTCLNRKTNTIIAENVIFIINNILKVYNTKFEELPCNVMKNDHVKYVENIFSSLQCTFKVESYSKLKLHLVDQLKACAPHLKYETVLNNHILAIYKTYDNENIFGDVIEAYETHNDTNKNQIQNQKVDSVKFTTPSNKVEKKSKKEASIINTVLVEGEEFVVVKSNWNFNPKKLTAKQKEKLQRKSENIPALYQDLSQSQEEFKLITWKTDSQDTTISTSSKSTNTALNEDVSAILKNIPNSEFLPKIIENVIVKPATDVSPELSKDKFNLNNEKSENKVQNVKDAKSPRMALKDRVFRNERNLIEKSKLGPQKEDCNVSYNNSENKTPFAQKIKPSSNVPNSAPSQTHTERPSRTKKKPSRYDDELAPIKRRRHSLNSQPDIEMINDEIQTHNTNKDKVDMEKEKIKNRDSLDFLDIATNVLLKENTIISNDRDLNAASSTPKSSKIKERKRFTDTKDEDKFTLNAKKKDANVKEQNHSNETRIELSTSECINMNESMKEKSCPDNSTSVCSIPHDRIEEKILSNGNTDRTPVSKINEMIDKQVLSNKKSSTKKSRIESQLAIDMVEGHPLLKIQSEKRSTRKSKLNSPISFNADNIKLKRKAATEAKNKIKDKYKIKTPVKNIPNTGTISASQDFIESSQDSAVTTMSVKSSKPYGKKMARIVLENLRLDTETETQNLIDLDLINMECDSDIELPCNTTSMDDLPEQIDTKPIDCNAVVILSDDEEPQTNSSVVVSLDINTQNTADVDTQSVYPEMFLETNDMTDTDFSTQITGTTEINEINDDRDVIIVESNQSLVATAEDITQTLSESVLLDTEKEDSSSSCNDQQRKRDFLDNTLQISPIKSVSPVPDQKSPSPETSSDYVVIKLASPVQSNGEPFEICESPEIFTEEKGSPDKRDRSPPREEVCVKNNSPSSSLSLKKNRPQMRSGGRAAQMLGLCVPDRLQTMSTSEKSIDVEEAKNSPSLNTTARRNLRILYNSSNGEGNDNSDDTEDSANFLKLKRSLPTTDCSPAGPILKKNSAEDESTGPPPSKRKRVSFQDPPVSTTICVKKYIEPISTRSPQNPAKKRLERQIRAQISMKSPRRLNNAFKLDSVLTKAVESFSDTIEIQDTTEDTEMSSLDETPVVEVVEISDLNDTDPICKELVHCEDHIENIAVNLSSPAMKELLIKQFQGRVDAIGDLAKMTELEVNRLCIKAPKIQVAKKVLNEYLSNIKRINEQISPKVYDAKKALNQSNDKETEEITPTVQAAFSESPAHEAQIFNELTTHEAQTFDAGLQTDSTSVGSAETQTECVAVSFADSQTDLVVTSHAFVQTLDSARKSTAEVISDCLTERPDFVERFSESIDEQSKQKIVEKLSLDSLMKIIADKIGKDEGTHVLSILQDHLTERLECKDLILFCSSLLMKVSQKPA